jgi:excisionase family DNA binding protein
MIEPIAMSINDAVAYSGLGRSSIYEALKAGHITAKKAGRRTLILVADLKAYVANLPQV